MEYGVHRNNQVKSTGTIFVRMKIVKFDFYIEND